MCRVLIRRAFTFGVLLFLLGVSPTLLAFPASVSAQSSSACPSNLIFHETIAGGVPAQLGATLMVSTASGFRLDEGLFYGIFPPYNPVGSGQYYNLSLIDSYRHNSNYTQWVVNIKPGLKWSNGTDVTANDILATYSNTFAFSPSLDFTGSYLEVSHEFALNTSAVEFDLKQPDAHFLETISEITLTTVLPAAYANPDFTGFNMNETVVGPFYPVSYSPGDTLLVMKRNPFFYTTGLPEPKICQLDVNFPESTSDAANYIATGSTDLAEIQPGSAALILKDNPYAHIVSQTANLIQDGTWNVTAYPLNMTAFRQAVVFGINETQIVEQGLAGYGVPGFTGEGVVPPTQTDLYNPNQMQYRYDPNESVSLLQSIGITKGSDNLMHYPNGTAVKITIWAANDFTQDIVAAGIIQQDLQNIGITVQVNVVNHHTINAFNTIAPASIDIYSSQGVLFPSAYSDALPGWDVYEHPAIPSQFWLFPESANSQYMSNLSAITATDNPTQMKQYLDNIQLLNAEFLPTLVISYGSAMWAYSTQNFVNWPPASQLWVTGIGSANNAIFSQLEPVTGTSTSTTSSGSMLNSPLFYGAIAAAVVIVLVVAGIALTRRRRSAPT